MSLSKLGECSIVVNFVKFAEAFKELEDISLKTIEAKAVAIILFAQDFC
jgi:hypothetical protein